MRSIRTIVLHHTATSESWTWERVWRLHVLGRGWDDGGYHFLIERGGGLRLGRPPHVQGAHVKHRNQDSLGVALVGDFTRGPVPETCWRTALSLVADLCRQYGLGPEDVAGHCELASHTRCPGFSPRDFRRDLRPLTAERRARMKR